MAKQLKLVRLTDFIVDVDSVDLLSGDIDLAVDGYLQAVAPIGATEVRESITLKLQGTSKDDLATITQDINEKIKQVQWWLDNPTVERYQIWLRVQLENESEPRQAMLYKIEPPQKVRVFHPEEINNNYIGEYQIGITRSPFWEPPFVNPPPAQEVVTALNVIGGMKQLATTINGDIPARLQLLSLGPEGGALHADYFIGFKTSRLGNPANFEPVWSLKDGTPYLDTATAADTSAYSGTRLTCTFATTATMAQRVGVLLSDVTANTADQRGQAEVLLRARISDDTTIVKVKMAYGFGILDGAPTHVNLLGGGTYRSSAIVNGAKNGASTGWGLFEVGSVLIPPLRLTTLLSIENFAITIDAQRISGSGSLYLDCLVLIPSEEGALHLRMPGGDIEASDSISIYQAPDQVNPISDTAGTTVFLPVTISPTNFSGLPANREAPYIVIAAQKYLGGGGGDKYISTKGETATMTYIHAPRWRTLRGNES